jgi:predicted ArsR family transcriptional regulator
VSTTPNGSARGTAARIGTALEGAADGLSMRELVSATRLHENALRRSLGRLVAGGSVHAEPQRRASRGRPSLRYRRAGSADEPFRHFLPLLLELVDRLPGADTDAFETGRAHGASTPAGTAGSATDAVAALLVTLGFDPHRQRDSASEGTSFSLDRCPFSEAVTSGRRGGRICALHHGLLAGVAEANGGELQTFTINDPRVRPCELTVR